MLFAIGELLGLGNEAYSHDGQFFRGRVVEGEYCFALGFGREGGFLLEDNLLRLRVKDLESGVAAEGLLREILDGGTQAALVTGTEESGHVQSCHHFLAGNGLRLDIGRL